jgi:hypothetical protein
MPPKKKTKSEPGSKDAKRGMVPPVPSSHELKFLFANLRQAGDLPSMYAALKLIRERMSKLDKGYAMTSGESDLYHKASLAVPYLMYKKAVDLLMRPRSMGGLAFASAKADATVRGIFEGAGIACCGTKMTEKKLLKSCSAVVSSPADARKILTKLAEVGNEARSKVNELAAALTEEASKAAVEAAADVAATAYHSTIASV